MNKYILLGTVIEMNKEDEETLETSSIKLEVFGESSLGKNRALLCVSVSKKEIEELEKAGATPGATIELVGFFKSYITESGELIPCLQVDRVTLLEKWLNEEEYKWKWTNSLYEKRKTRKLSW